MNQLLAIVLGLTLAVYASAAVSNTAATCTSTTGTNAVTADPYCNTGKCDSGLVSACLAGQCKTGYGNTPYGDSAACVACDPTCSTCDAGTSSSCLSCPSLTSFTTAQSNIYDAKACGTTTAACTSTTGTGAVTADPYCSTNKCISPVSSCAPGECKTGYGNDPTNGGACAPCTAASNCATCTATAAVCQTCNTGYYVDSNSVCSKCVANCVDCASATKCTACASDYTLNTDGTACTFAEKIAVSFLLAAATLLSLVL